MYKGYLLGACRTPIGSYGGAFKDKKPAELGILVVKDALRRAGIRPEQVDELVFGCVLTGGHGQNIARQVSVGAGIPIEKPAATISKVCGSGLAAVVAASRMVQLGDADCVVAGGVEVMSQAPYVMPSNRWGARMGDVQVVDSMIRDGLWDYFNDYHMGITAENVAEQWGLSREEQDAFACASQQKAAAALENGDFEDEIVPVEVKVKREVKQVTKDEFVRPGTTMEALAKLRPAFKKDGTVTAGNASGINDGAACVIVVSEKFLKENNLKPMAGIVSYHSAGVKPEIMGVGPVPSVQGALAKAGLGVEDIDLFELNEAFASQSIAVCRDLKVPADKVNIHGGAIALGHPIGASGARILVTLLHAMQHENVKRGVASLCIGGGMGEAMIVERELNV